MRRNDISTAVLRRYRELPLTREVVDRGDCPGVRTSTQGVDPSEVRVPLLASVINFDVTAELRSVHRQLSGRPSVGSLIAEAGANPSILTPRREYTLGIVGDNRSRQAWGNVQEGRSSLSSERVFAKGSFQGRSHRIASASGGSLRGAVFQDGSFSDSGPTQRPLLAYDRPRQNALTWSAYAELPWPMLLHTVPRLTAPFKSHTLDAIWVNA